MTSLAASTPVRDSRTIRSFIDLRAFAAGSEKPTTSVDDPDRFLASRTPLALPPGPVTVAALRLNDSGGTVARLPADEFVIVLNGELMVSGAGVTLTLSAGGSGVLPAGISFSWNAKSGTVAIVMSCNSGPAGAQRPIEINHNAAREPSNPPLAELLIGPTPSCRNHSDYRSANGEFSCGTWDSTAYHRRAMSYRHYELMHLLEGEVTLVDGAGRSQTFRKGDVLLCEQGADCSWYSTVHVAKVYAIYRPS